MKKFYYLLLINTTNLITLLNIPILNYIAIFITFIIIIFIFAFIIFYFISITIVIQFIFIIILFLLFFNSSALISYIFYFIKIKNQIVFCSINCIRNITTFK